jgi:hypothetical protein
MAPPVVVLARLVASQTEANLATTVPTVGGSSTDDVDVGRKSRRDD